jgi:nucleoside-diphosphate-sugar epimerase
MKPLIGITGCTGSLGKNLLSNSKNFFFKCFTGDIRKKNQINKWILKNNFSAIIHLAAIVPIKDVNKNKKKAMDVNFLGTKNIVDTIKNTKIKWFFFSSTSHVYKSKNLKISETDEKQPISYYGKTKLQAENYIVKHLKKYNIKYCIGRIFSTANKDQKKNYLVPDLKKKIKNTKKKVVLKNLNHFRDFISMLEITKIILILYKKKFNGIINIGSGKGIYLKDIAKIISKKYKKKIEFKDNKTPTFLVSDNSKLKKIVNIRINSKLEELIF